MQWYSILRVESARTQPLCAGRGWPTAHWSHESGWEENGTISNADLGHYQNHGHMVSLHFMHYNFARVHKTLRITPAEAAGDIYDGREVPQEIVMMLGKLFSVS